jgi:ABC-type spermidine/putrescine transport system permease subunit I
MTRRQGDPDRRQALRRGLLGLPAVIVIASLLLYPLAMLVALGFQGKTGEVGLEQYIRVATTPVYGLVLWRTAWIAALVTLINFLIGYPFAVALSRARGAWRSLLLLAVMMPFWTNLLVRAYGWIVVLHPNGLVNTALLSLGLNTEPVELVQNTTGVLIGMSQIMLPYMVLPIAAQIEKLDLRLLQAARSLGASALRTFLHVYFPLTLPGVFAGALIVLVLSLGFFVIPALLGGRRDVLIAQLIDFNLTKVLNWEFAAALSTVLLLATVGVFLAAQRWFRLDELWTEAR